MRLMHATGLALLLAAHPAVSQPAPRDVPAKAIPVPLTVSSKMQAIIAQPYGQRWNVVPKSSAEWKAIVDKAAAQVITGLPRLREGLGVAVQPTTIAGVKAFIVTPKEIPPGNRDRVLVHVHGGYYVLAPGEAGTREAIVLAGFGGFKVISVDYRMPPEFPYPAALDDAMAVYRAVLETTPSRNVGIIGASAGGGLTLAMVLRAKQERLPLPGAIAPGTPWSDMTKMGYSYFANEMVDNVLVSDDGFGRAAALLYANGHDLKDPLLSPVYGDMHGFRHA